MAGTPTALGDANSIPPEKSIVLKGWEKLDDDVIIKEVSTKGKHVNLCIQYLAERNELSLKEAKNYFLQKVHFPARILLLAMRSISLPARNSRMQPEWARCRMLLPAHLLTKQPAVSV